MKKREIIFHSAFLAVWLVLAFTAFGHTHIYPENWSKNETAHWRACTKKGCDKKWDEGEHIRNGGEITTLATPSADGVRTYTCTVCGQTITESVPYVPPVILTENIGFAAPESEKADENARKFFVFDMKILQTKEFAYQAKPEIL